MASKFDIDLQAGHAGEARLAVLRPGWIRTNGMVEDFVLPDGATLELKTESRTASQTPNLAIELHSSAGKQGALGRAVQDGIDYIAYFFADDALFVYNPAELLTFVLANINNYRVVPVRNATYDTTVILVPRNDVAHLRINGL